VGTMESGKNLLLEGATLDREHETSLEPSFERRCFRRKIVRTSMLFIVSFLYVMATILFQEKNADEKLESALGRTRKINTTDSDGKELPRNATIGIVDALTKTPVSPPANKVTKYSLELPDNYQKLAYDLAVQRSLQRDDVSYANLKEYAMRQTNATSLSKRFLLNLVRVPKAASSELSVVARAIVGCKPDGFPCCRAPPVREACPRKDLFCKFICGCVDHRPRFPLGVPSLTSLREPAARILSAFFYQGPHRPPGSNHSWTFFVEEYIKDPVFQNVMSKMLNEQYAYASPLKTGDAVLASKQRLCQIEVFGLNSPRAALGLLLYETGVFSHLIPNPVVFDLPATFTNKDAQDNLTSIMKLATRKSQNQEYPIFKSQTYVDNQGEFLVRLHNKEDFEVYDFAVKLYCARLREIEGFLQAVADAGLLGLYPECTEDFLVSMERNDDTENNSTEDEKTVPSSTSDLCSFE